MHSLANSVVECVYLNAGSTPDKLAVVAEGVEVTYAKLWKNVLSFCDYLSRDEVAPGSNVLIQASHSAEYVTAYLGASLRGCSAVPYEENMPVDAVLDLACRVGGSCIVSNQDFGSTDAKVIRPQYEDDICVDVEALCPSEFPGSDDVAELLFTTGTTGKSKTVVLTHRAIMSVEQNIITATGILSDNVSLVPMPLNHVFALRRLQVALAIGATAVLVNGVASLKKLFSSITTYHITSLSLVPSALAYIEKTTRNYLEKFAGQIRFVESSSAPLPSATRDWLRSVLPQSKLYNSYGCTESTACCMLEYSKRTDDASCVGTPCCTADIKILDLSTGTDTTGEGRIAIGGSGVMSGYLNDEEATARTLVNGYVLTNDLGCFKDGELHVLGRIDDVVLIGGNNVSPGEVEDALLKADFIEDCACVGAHHAVAGDHLVMFVVGPSLQKDASEAALKVREYLKGIVEPYKIPDDIRVIDEVPRTYNGKIDRKQLRALANED